jgi:DNA modification methylase
MPITRPTTLTLELPTWAAGYPYEIRQGDSALVLKSLQDNSIDLWICSPPYSVAGNKARESKEYKSEFDFDGVFREKFRTLKGGHFLVYNEGCLQGADGQRAINPERHCIRLIELGFKLHNRIIWDKGTAPNPDTHRYNESCYENIYVFYKPNGEGTYDHSQVNIIRDRENICANQKVVKSSRGRNCELINKRRVDKLYATHGLGFALWYYPVGGGKSYSEKYMSEHPALMSEAVAERAIKSFVKPVQDDGSISIVGDGFAGGFTSNKMALTLGMRAIGIEYSMEFCLLGKRRLEEAFQGLNQKSIVSDINMILPEPKIKIIQENVMLHTNGIQEIERVTLDSPEFDFRSIPFLISADIPETKKKPVMPIETPEIEVISSVKNTSKSFIMSCGELCALGKSPSNFLVEDRIPEKGLILMGGIPKSGKSYWALLFTLLISIGGMIFGKKSAKSRVLYINKDAANNGFAGRYNRMSKFLGIDPANNPNFVAVTEDLDLDINDELGFQVLRDLVRDSGAKFVVLDTVAAVSSHNEQNGQQVKQLFKKVREFAYQENIVILALTHHGRRGAEIGHNAKEGAAETIFAVHKKGNGRSVLEVVDSRHRGNENESVEVQFSDDELNDAFSYEVVPEVDLTNPLDGSSGRSEVQQTILGMLSKVRPTYRKDIAAEGGKHGYSIKEVDAALHALEGLGQITKQRDTQAKGRGNRAHVYFLASSEVGYQEAA